MYLLAAKFAASLLVPGWGPVGDLASSYQLSSAEQQVWRQVQPSILVISQGGVSRGSAACIETGGFYLAHRNSVRNGPIDGVTFTGQTYPMRMVAQDPPTGLILLQVDGRQAPDCPVVRIADEEHARRGTLLAVLSTGPVRADIGQPNIVATYERTKQAVLLNEIRFAAPPQMLTGALLFDDRGNLVGVLGATLPRAQNPAASPGGAFSKLPLNGGAGILPANQSAAGGGAGYSEAKRSAPIKAVVKIGPADLNVAYAVSPMLLDRVVAGFLSPTHEVLHPALGAVCADELINGVSEGAAIRRISKGSGADKAGLRVGDVIVNIEGSEIHTVVDYARVMLAQEVGHRITIAIRRGMQTIPVDAVVGRATDPSQLQQELDQAGK